MKTLSFEKMEKLQGGSDYCDTLRWWILNDYEGYQGNIGWLHHWYEKYCMTSGAQCLWK